MEEKAKKKLTVKPNAESETVKLIFALCIGGMGGRAIARRLDEMGFPPWSGGSWSSASVMDILRNPVYCGKIRWQFRREERSSENGIVTRRRSKNPDCILVEGLHPAIISGSDFERVQLLMSSRREPPKTQSSELRNPLSGLVCCGLCGAMMTRLGSGAHNRSDILRCPNRSCRNVSSKLSLVEDALAEVMSQWLNGCRVEVCRKPAENSSTELAGAGAAKLRTELAGMEKQRDRIYSFLEQGVYSPEEFRERMETLEQRRALVSEQMEQFERQLSEAEESRPRSKDSTPAAVPVMEIYSNSPPADKNRLLKAVFSRVSYIKSGRNNRGEPGRFGFTLEVMPLFPKSSK